MLQEYTYRYGKNHGAGKHSMLSSWCSHIPEGELTPHPQCFSGHDDLKTDEDYPINAYRAFYKRDKVSFARWNKNRVKPDWFMDA